MFYVINDCNYIVSITPTELHHLLAQEMVVLQSVASWVITLALQFGRQQHVKLKKF
jgi:hypothetical protein